MNQKRLLRLLIAAGVLLHYSTVICMGSEGNNTESPILSSADYQKAYTADVARRIMRAYRPKKIGVAESTVLTCVMRKDGRPANVKVEKGSNDSSFDLNCVRVLKGVAPYRPPLTEFELEVSFSSQLVAVKVRKTK